MSDRIQRYDVPPVEALLQIAGVTPDLAAKLHAVLAGEIDPCEASEACAAWVRQCHREPCEQERILAACDDLLDGHGAEALNIEGAPSYRDGTGMCPPFSYVNFGDPYVTTLVRDHADRQWVVSGWGDLVEEYESENELGSYFKHDEEPARCWQCHATAFTFNPEEGEHGAWVCDSCDHAHLAADGCAPEQEEGDSDD